MKLPRFTLRFLLVVVTIAAMCLWAYQSHFVERPISYLDVSKIDLGMTHREVKYALGPPHYTYTNERETWRYNVQGKMEYINFSFDNGRLSAIERQGYLPWLDGPEE